MKVLSTLLQSLHEASVLGVNSACLQIHSFLKEWLCVHTLVCAHACVVCRCVDGGRQSIP